MSHTPAPMEEAAASIDQFFVLLAALFVFFMQLGFMLLEAGSVRAKNAASIVEKNIADSVIAIVIFWAIGWAVAFGDGNDFFGHSEFFLSGLDDAKYLRWFFQVAFANTASTIVSGSLAERTRFLSYFAFSAAFTGIIYPVVAHWVWAGGLLSSGFLGTQGVVDYSGSLVIHFTGGLAGLLGAVLVGPRIGYVDPRTQETKPIPGHNLVFVSMGTLVLLLGWIMFNAAGGASFAAHERQVGKVILVTLLAGAGGAVGGSLTSVVYSKKKAASIPVLCNGLLGGLVAVTAPCGVIDPWAGFVVGLCGGIVWFFSDRLLHRFRIDDPLSAAAVHGFCGAFGTLVPGFLSTSAKGGSATLGLFYGGNGQQLVAQVAGLGLVFVWVLASSLVLFILVDRGLVLRALATEELLGLDRMLGSAYPEWFQLQETLGRTSTTRLRQMIADEHSLQLLEFAHLLKKSHALESLDFVVAVRHHKFLRDKADFSLVQFESAHDLQAVSGKARALCDLYVKSGSDKEVNISRALREEILHFADQPNAGLGASLSGAAGYRSSPLRRSTSGFFRPTSRATSESTGSPAAPQGLGSGPQGLGSGPRGRLSSRPGAAMSASRRTDRSLSGQKGGAGSGGVETPPQKSQESSPAVVAGSGDVLSGSGPAISIELTPAAASAASSTTAASDTSRAASKKLAPATTTISVTSEDVLEVDEPSSRYQSEISVETGASSSRSAAHFNAFRVQEVFQDAVEDILNMLNRGPFRRFTNKSYASLMTHLETPSRLSWSRFRTYFAPHTAVKDESARPLVYRVMDSGAIKWSWKLLHKRDRKKQILAEMPEAFVV